MTDYYRILQVIATADHEVIEGAYKRLMLKYHPDRNQSPDALGMSQQLNEAYAVLSDPHKRRCHDVERLAYRGKTKNQEKHGRQWPSAMKATDQPSGSEPNDLQKKSDNGFFFIGLAIALPLACLAFVVAFAAFDKPNSNTDRNMEILLTNFRKETIRSTEIAYIDYKATASMKSELDYLIVTEFDGGFTTTEFRGDKQKGELRVNVPAGGWKPGSKIWLGRPQSTNPGALPIRVSNAIAVS